MADINNPPVGTVSITGVATQGQVLTASNSLTDADGLGEITYTWFASGSGTAIGTGPTYTLTQAEVGKAITVTASYTDGYNTVESKTSIATSAVLAIPYNLVGTPNVDTLTGMDNADTLSGLGGIDVLNGGEGSDLYVMTLATDHPAAEINDTGINGTDEVRFTSTTANQTLTLFAGDIGIEKVTIGTGDAAQAVTTGTTALNVNAAAVTKAHNLTGNALANTLTGNAQNNTLDGGADAVVDVLVGGAGDDTYIVDLTTAGALQDTITEIALATNNDTVQLRGRSTNTAAVTLTLAANLENLDASATDASLLNLTGNNANNRLTGNAAANTLDGLAGADTMAGGIGNDTYVVDNAGDIVTELLGEGTDLVQVAIATAAGTYVMAANVENGTLTNTVAYNLTGNELGNTLTGNAAANTLTGLGGDDILDGLAGADTMAGGIGNDTYTVDNVGDVVVEGSQEGTDTFNTALNATSNIDTITDFVSGTDKIELENLIMTGLGLTTGQLTIDQFRSGAGVSAAGDSSDRVIYNNTTGELFYDADGLGGTAAIQIALIGGNPLLTHQDIFIV
ncbi:COG2931 RTX toxins and related Ca2+-binding proteins [Methylophilaceae bacterium]